MRRVLSWILVSLIAAAPMTGVAQSGTQNQVTAGNSSLQVRQTKVLPGTRSDVFSTIQGTALDSGDRPLAEATVRLRDVRSGRIVDVTVTDKSGLFIFRSVDPGSYIVELVGSDKTTVLAASGMLNVNAGTAATTIVKLPLQTKMMGGVLGRTATSAILVTTAAAAAGVLATQISGDQKSPRQ